MYKWYYKQIMKKKMNEKSQMKKKQKLFLS